MHLTNYAINKHNENFVRDDAMGSKRYPLFCFPLLPLPLVPQSQESHETKLSLGKLISQEPLLLKTLVLCLSSKCRLDNLQP